MSNFQYFTSWIFYSKPTGNGHHSQRHPVFVLQNVRAVTSYTIMFLLFDGPLLNIFAFKRNSLYISSGSKKTASHSAVPIITDDINIP